MGAMVIILRLDSVAPSSAIPQCKAKQKQRSDWNCHDNGSRDFRALLWQLAAQLTDGYIQLRLAQPDPRQGFHGIRREQ